MLRWTLAEPATRRAGIVAASLCGVALISLLAPLARAQESGAAPGAPTPSLYDKLRTRSAKARWQQLNSLPAAPAQPPSKAGPNVAGKAASRQEVANDAPFAEEDPADDLPKILPQARPDAVAKPPLSNAASSPERAAPAESAPEAVSDEEALLPARAADAGPGDAGEPPPVEAVDTESLTADDALQPVTGALQPGVAPDQQGSNTSRFKRLQDISPYFDYERDSGMKAEKVGDEGEMAEIALPSLPASQRMFPQAEMQWEANNFWHYPLYFEDFGIERYGQSRHYLIQPVYSVALFAAQAGFWPYQLVIDPICRRRYQLGLYRPGERTPYLYYQFPWNAEAMAWQVGTVTGSYFLFAPGFGP